MPFAGFQVLEHETPHHVIHAFMQATVALGYTFKQLKLFGMLGVGSTTFVRCQTSCPSGRLKIIGITMSAAEDKPRRVVLPDDKGTYLIYVQGERYGQVSTTSMHTVPGPGLVRTYRGPTIEHWERQFHDIQKQNAGP